MKGRKGNGRLAKGQAGHFQFVPDKGCQYSPKCLSCHLPTCKLEDLEKARGGRPKKVGLLEVKDG